MKCNECGSEIRPGSRFCSHCGAQAPAAAPVSPQSERPAPAQQRLHVALLGRDLQGVQTVRQLRVDVAAVVDVPFELVEIAALHGQIERHAGPVRLTAAREEKQEGAQADDERLLHHVRKALFRLGRGQA